MSKECFRAPLRTLLCLILALMLTLGATGWAAAETTGVVVGGNLHLRATPSLEGEKLAIYDTGTEVTILGKEGDWYHVRLSNGDEGYMEAEYVMVNSEGRVENGAKHVNLRSAPDTGATIVGEFTTGTHLTVLGTEGDWSHVSIEGEEGYMLSRFIVPADPLPAELLQTQVENPLAIDTTAQKTTVHQVGEEKADASTKAPLFFTIEYPLLDIAAPDKAIQGWVQDAVIQGQAALEGAAAGTEATVTSQYDTYLIDDRYIGVLMTGAVSDDPLTKSTDLVYTLNVDTKDGSILQPADLIASNQGVIVLLRQQLGGLVSEDTDITDSWLQYAVLTPEGLALLLPKGDFLPEALGTSMVVLPYDQLNEQGLLEVQVQGGVEAEG